MSTIGSLGAAKHGLVRTADVPTDQRRRLRHLADRGQLERVGAGVYRIAGAPATWHQALHIGVWSLGETAVVSHSSAAQLHAFDGFTGDVIEFTVDRSRRDRKPGRIEAIVHSTTDRRPGDVLLVAGLPVTSAERTLCDLSRDGCDRAALEAAVDSAIRLRLTTLDRLIDRIGRLEGGDRWGFAPLDSLIATSGGHTFLERRFLEIVRAAHLPVPTPQVIHRVGGRHVARVDFLFVDHGVVVEVSGGRGHSSASDRAKDASRRNQLQQLGRLVLEFTHEQVTRRPDLVVADLQAALTRRTPSAP